MLSIDDIITSLKRSAVSFVPSMFTFSLFVSPRWVRNASDHSCNMHTDACQAGILGAVYTVARAAYAHGHQFHTGVEKPSLLVSSLTQASLLVGTFVAGMCGFLIFDSLLIVT